MTTERRLERDLPPILGDLAMGPYPDYIDDVLATTAQRRQRPAWTFPERWLPMDLTSDAGLRTAPSPGAELGVLALIALLLAAAAGGVHRLAAAASGAVRARRPTASSPIVDDPATSSTVDPVSGEAVAIVAGTRERAGPTYSPNGPGSPTCEPTAIPRSTSSLRGRTVRDRSSITPEPHLGRGLSRRGRPTAPASSSRSPPVASTSTTRPRPAPPRTMSVEGQRLGAKGFDDYNGSIQDLFRPPTGVEIMFLGSTALRARRSSLPRPMGPLPARSSTESTRRSRYSTSTCPSGRRTDRGSRSDLALPERPEPDWHIVRRRTPMGRTFAILSRETHPEAIAIRSWSPDGTHIAFQRWFSNESLGPCDDETDHGGRRRRRRRDRGRDRQRGWLPRMELVS